MERFKKLVLPLFALAIFSCSYVNDERIDFKKIEQELDQLGQSDSYSGNWVIADDEQILLNRSYGISNIESNTAITSDTRFNLASVNKIFTALSIMLLHEDGAIDLQKTISDYIQDYPNPSIANKVSIEQLLTHTSGMGDMFTPAFEEADPNSIRELQDYLDKFASDPLQFEPGKQFGYSNAGYIVLGLIIEEISGQTYYDYVQYKILDPLGMQNTGWYHGDDAYDTVATAYYEQDASGTWIENPYLVMKGSSAGGGYSTVADLLTFARALENGKIVSFATLDEMKKDRFDNGYGYGLSLRKLNDQFVYGHNGGFPGVSAEIDIFPASGLYSVSLSNRSPRNGWSTARSVVRNAIVGSIEEAEGVLNAGRIVAIYEDAGLDAATTEVQNIEGSITVNELISASEKYDKAGQTHRAIDILTLCSMVEPENWFVVSIKADLQFKLGEVDNAVKNWKKSLELNPDNQWAKDKLSEFDSSSGNKNT